MPHIIIEYSENIEKKIDIFNLVERIHESAIATGIFTIGGLRVRAAKRDHYKIGDGHSDNGFVHVELKIGPGRDKKAKITALERIFETVEDCLGTLHKSGPLAMSAELNEFDEDLRINKNNIHKYIKERGIA